MEGMAEYYFYFPVALSNQKPDGDESKSKFSADPGLSNSAKTKVESFFPNSWNLPIFLEYWKVQRIVSKNAWNFCLEMISKCSFFHYGNALIIIAIIIRKEKNVSCSNSDSSGMAPTVRVRLRKHHVRNETGVGLGA